MKVAPSGRELESALVKLLRKNNFSGAEHVSVFVVGPKPTPVYILTLGADVAKVLVDLLTPVLGKRTQPSSTEWILAELSGHAAVLEVENRLRAYGDALSSITSRAEAAHWFLLELQPSIGELNITGFSLPEREEAEREYAAAEQRVRERPGTDAVLVSVDSLAQLEKAYPNYFADTRVFVELMNQSLSGKRRQIRLSPLKMEAPLNRPIQGTFDLD